MRAHQLAEGQVGGQRVERGVGEGQAARVGLDERGAPEPGGAQVGAGATQGTRGVIAAHGQPRRAAARRSIEQRARPQARLR